MKLLKLTEDEKLLKITEIPVTSTEDYKQFVSQSKVLDTSVYVFLLTSKTLWLNTFDTTTTTTTTITIIFYRNTVLHSPTPTKTANNNNRPTIQLKPNRSDENE